MITREQVKDLRPGDVVELSVGRYTIRGPLDEIGTRGSGCSELRLHMWVIRNESGDAYQGHTDRTLTVVSRAPRPLYVNHDREKPVPGDVVEFRSVDHPEDGYVDVYLPRSEHDTLPWVSLTGDVGTRYSDEDARADHLDGWTTRLLVDGDTGRSVSS